MELTLSHKSKKQKVIYYPQRILIHEFECSCMLVKDYTGVHFVQCIPHWQSQKREIRGLMRP